MNNTIELLGYNGKDRVFYSKGPFHLAWNNNSDGTRDYFVPLLDLQKAIDFIKMNNMGYVSWNVYLPILNNN